VVWLTPCDRSYPLRSWGDQRGADPAGISGPCSFRPVCGSVELAEALYTAHQWATLSVVVCLCPGLTSLSHVAGTVREVMCVDLLTRAYRQAPLEVDVAELVDRASLAQYTTILVRVGEKAH
jgi:hypothetical protein